MSDLIGRTLGHYRIVEKIALQRNLFEIACMGIYPAPHRYRSRLHNGGIYAASTECSRYRYCFASTVIRALTM